MKKVIKQRTACTLLILIVLAILASTLTGCGGGVVIDGKRGGTVQDGQGNIRQISAPDATATFGANEFHIQLTAIATQEAAPYAP